MTKTEIIHLIVLAIFCALIMWILCGCNTSYVKMSNDPNSLNFYEFSGSAADTISTQIADNMKTKESRFSEMFAYNKYLFAGLIGFMVIGFAFWGWTGSKYGWIIPASCLSGIGAIVFFTQNSFVGRLIFGGVLAVGVVLLLWKAIEYHGERDKELAKGEKNRIAEVVEKIVTKKS